LIQLHGPPSRVYAARRAQPEQLEHVRSADRPHDRHAHLFADVVQCLLARPPGLVDRRPTLRPRAHQRRLCPRAANRATFIIAATRAAESEAEGGTSSRGVVAPDPDTDAAALSIGAASTDRLLLARPPGLVDRRPTLRPRAHQRRLCPRAANRGRHLVPRSRRPGSRHGRGGALDRRSINCRHVFILSPFSRSPPSCAPTRPR
jgi:hypothetical protein